MDTEFERFLTDISNAFIDRIFDQWRNRLLLPFSLVTKLKPIVLTTEDAVLDSFQQYLIAVKMMNLDLIDRVPISLEECPDGT